MTYEEKGIWVYLLVSAGVYIAYVAIVLGQAEGDPTSVAYQPILFWSIIASIVAAIVIRIVVEIVRPSDNYRSDERDKQIARNGFVAGSWLIIAGALGGMLLAMVEADFFWIANVIYLGFVASAVFDSIVRLTAYRRGF